MTRSGAMLCAHASCRNRTTDASGRCHMHRSTPGSPVTFPRSVPEVPGAGPSWNPGTPHPAGGYDKVNRYPGYDGTVEISYSRNGLPHREDGPASIVIADTGVILRENYMQNSRPHRVDGPALAEWTITGEPLKAEYVLDGKRHRLDGPASVEYDGDEVTSEEFFVHGQGYTAEEFARLREALDSGSPEEWAIAYARGESS